MRQDLQRCSRSLFSRLQEGHSTYSIHIFLNPGGEEYESRYYSTIRYHLKNVRRVADPISRIDSTFWHKLYSLCQKVESILFTTWVEKYFSSTIPSHFSGYSRFTSSISARNILFMHSVITERSISGASTTYQHLELASPSGFDHPEHRFSQADGRNYHLTK